MTEQINVNIQAVTNVLRKCAALNEEIQILLSEADKSIANAEIEGWNDFRYHTFRDSFYDTKSYINNATKRIEEEHIPYLKKIIRSSEEF